MASCSDTRLLRLHNIYSSTTLAQVFHLSCSVQIILLFSTPSLLWCLRIFCLLYTYSCHTPSYQKFALVFQRLSHSLYTLYQLACASLPAMHYHTVSAWIGRRTSVGGNLYPPENLSPRIIFCLPRHIFLG